MSKGNAITIESRALWLMLQRQRGWWTVRMLVKHWEPTFSEFEMLAVLQALHHGGFVMRQDGLTGQQWAVTDDCLALPGILREQPAQHYRRAA